MAKIYDRRNYRWVESVSVNGKTLTSSYNHNYYKNINTGEIILEECDDADCFDYSLITSDGQKHYIGSLFCVWGIFPNELGELPNDVREEEDGGVEVYD
jgi:hypothetical protein